jgi:hypothetical protein
MELKTNHSVRIVTLTTSERVLCLFGEVRDDEEKVIGYRMLYPFILGLSEPNEDGTIPIEYRRFCPYSPVEEHRLSGDHIISVVFPDNGILDNYVEKLEEYGFPKEQVFFEKQTEVAEETNGDSSEPTEAGE